MTTKKLPNATAVYLLALLSICVFCFAGIGVIPAVISYLLAGKSEKIYVANPESYSNFSTIKKGKIIAIVALVLNLMIMGIAIWTLTTIGWDAWSDEFVRKWNAGLDTNGGY
ncbi:CCC motif membrane protein [Maribacter antarcticus]|uniref:CCC motif membrane protein n=1 Tax=Maribacter antarcticus TaxID=505250 RepID=UPI0004794BF8|nr:CCC motif membrane protein [Maribacter antarcticus]